MESRHKMLMVRQRSLLSRRVSRGNNHNSPQPGFFGRTKPGNVELNLSPSKNKNRNYRNTGSPHSRGMSSEDTEGRNSRDFESKTIGISPREKSRRGLEPPALLHSEHNEHQQRSQNSNQHGQRRSQDKKKKDAGPPQVPSIESRIRMALGVSATPEKSQKQAVIDRISAIRAARLRRNRAFGNRNHIGSNSNRDSIRNSSRNSNLANEESKPHRTRGMDPQQALPQKQDTIDESISDPVPGYRYYPHNNSNEPRHPYDDQSLSTNDQSLSTFDSNPQEYAATLVID
mmetsp:Transcript_1345/g.2855  ORF Transcript_1345/g.2855 Transcript_1345/m.2855 type:complete len:287 (+) Transcript_1345:1-861(+)